MPDGASYFALATDVGGTLMFNASDGVHGFELWRSDGTAAGTTLVRDINPGNAGSVPDWYAPAGGRLFFSAIDAAHGRECGRRSRSPGAQAQGLV